MLGFYKFVFEIASIFTIESVITSLIWQDAPPLIPMIILIGVGAIYMLLVHKKVIEQASKRKIACVFLLPLSLIAFGFAGDSKGLVFLAWLYVAFVFTTGRTDGNYYYARSNYFMLTGILLGLIFVLAAMSIAIKQQMALMVTAMAPFVITMQVSGFLMLRLFREETLMKSNTGYRKYRRVEQVALVGLIAASWAGDFLDTVADVARRIYYTVIEPIIRFIGNAFGMGVLWIMQQLGKLFDTEWDYRMDEIYNDMSREQNDAKEQLQNVLDLGTESQPINFALIATIAVSIIAILLMLLLILKLLSGRKSETVEGNVIETRERIQKEKKERDKKEERERSSRNSIRKAYRRYLIQYKRKKVPLTSSMTATENAVIIGKNNNPEVQQEIKQAYQKARYCTTEEPGWNEANTFKELIKKQQHK